MDDLLDLGEERRRSSTTSVRSDDRGWGLVHGWDKWPDSPRSLESGQTPSQSPEYKSHHNGGSAPRATAALAVESSPRKFYQKLLGREVARGRTGNQYSSLTCVCVAGEGGSNNWVKTKQNLMIDQNALSPGFLAK